MAAISILTNVAIVLVVATLWIDMREGGRITSAKRTWLLIACIFSLLSSVVGLLY